MRTLPIDAYISCVEEVFEKYIIYNDDIKKNKWLKEQDVAKLLKLINSCVHAIIIKRFSLRDFEHYAEMVFGLNNEKIDFLWEIIQKNKQELRTNYIISQLEKISSILGDND